MDQKLRTERRKLADLKAAEYNPRKALTPDDAEYQKIRRSIEEFGYVDPIIINEDGRKAAPVPTVQITTYR